MSRIVAITLLLVLTSPLRAAAGPADAPIREILDVRYFPGLARHKLDIFVPDNGKAGPYPVVFFVHGGTWMFGDKNFFGLYRGVGKFLARNGYVAVMINYRLSPVVKHPEHVKDVARAFAWTHRHIHRHGGDPTRIVIAGHSAGAHLGTLLVTDQRYLDDPTLKLDRKARDAIKCVVAVSGVYRIPGREEFRTMAAQIVENLGGEPGKVSFVAAIAPALLLVSNKVSPFDVVFGKDEAVHTKASPLTYVRRGLPPFLLLNASKEPPGLWTMAEDFVDALKKHGVSVEWQECKGATHRTIVRRLHSADEDGGKAILAFLNKHLPRAGRGS